MDSLFSFTRLLNRQHPLTVPPKLIRQLLTTGLATYPTSTELWTVLIVDESRSARRVLLVSLVPVPHCWVVCSMRIAGRLRAHMASVQLDPVLKDSPVVWLMSLAAEVLLPYSQ